MHTGLLMSLEHFQTATAGLHWSASTVAPCSIYLSLCLLFVFSRKAFLKIDVLPDGDRNAMPPPIMLSLKPVQALGVCCEVVLTWKPGVLLQIRTTVSRTHLVFQ